MDELAIGGAFGSAVPGFASSEATLRLIRCLASRLIETDAMSAKPESAVSKLMSLLAAWHAAPLCPPQAPRPSRFHCIAMRNMGLPFRSSARRASRHRSFAKGSPPTPGGSSAISTRTSMPIGGRRLPKPRLSSVPTRPLQTIAAISGLAQENMNRGAGWRLFDAGRRIERSINTCRFAHHFATSGSPAEDLDVLLDLVDSQITYRSRYLMGLALTRFATWWCSIRSIRACSLFQVERLDEHLANLPLLSDDGMLEPPRRLILQLAAEIAMAIAQYLDNETILGFEQSLLFIADAIAARYFLQGPHVARADKSSGLA
jgi:A predicted alpha-helical domain with a conserved ER motif.